MPVNPNKHVNKIRSARSASNEEALIEGIKNGSMQALSKAITLAESDREDHRKTSLNLIDELLPLTGKSIRIGITGVPGVGKSTFIEAFGMFLIEKGHKVAVLAVDPSSSKSGGSILGDKTRMETLSRNENAFIRPTPSGKDLGGVARYTREAILLCEASGFDIILVETVGVGQSEAEVRAMVDYFLLLTLPGAGDELQGIKRGIMEMAHGIAVNKSDGDNVKRARIARAELITATHLFPPLHGEWSIPIILISALEQTGMDEIWESTQKYIDLLRSKNKFEELRHAQNEEWVQKTMLNAVGTWIKSNPEMKAFVSDLFEQLKNGQIASTTALARVEAEISRRLNG